MYDRHYSFGENEEDSEWSLPERWLDPPSTFDLSTPYNFVSTADIIGGNSGSPVLNSDLDLVGLAFDGNIESLPGDYIFLTDVPRTVSVDVRGILEALAEIYQADRIVARATVDDLVGSEVAATVVYAASDTVSLAADTRIQFVAQASPVAMTAARINRVTKR